MFSVTFLNSCTLVKVKTERDTKWKRSQISVFHICIMMHYVDSISNIHNHITHCELSWNIKLQNMFTHQYAYISTPLIDKGEYGGKKPFPPCSTGKKLQFIKHNDNMPQQHSRISGYIGFYNWKLKINRKCSLFTMFLILHSKIVQDIKQKKDNMHKF